MTPSLKPLSREAIPAAVAKAERYRLLNEPGQAESICLDVLRVDPAHQAALATLILALTDQFADQPARMMQLAREILPRLDDEYSRAYYAGIISERRAHARLALGGHGASDAAREWLKEALVHYAVAESLRPPNNDDAILRWNACVRTLERHPDTESGSDDQSGRLMMLE